MKPMESSAPTETIPNTVQDERLKPYRENVTNAFKDKLQRFGEKLNPQVVEILTKDMTGEANYRIDVTDNPYATGIVLIKEKWDGGERSMMVFDERYKPLNEFDNQPGDWVVGFTQNEFNFDQLKLDLHYNSNQESLRQETICTTERAKASVYGQGALMSGEFFKYAGRGKMVENTYFEKDGTKSYNRVWEGERYLGPNDRYQTTRVIDDDGIVQMGTRKHGMVIGLIFPLEVVSKSVK